jgi:hypothetical protein
MQGKPRSTPPPNLALNPKLCGEILTVAQLEMRDPQHVLDLLLSWALRQHRLLELDLGTLGRVAVSDCLFDWDDTTECVISGEWQAADGHLSRLLVR